MSDGRAWPAYSGSLSLHTGETETLLHRVISRYHRVPHYPFRVMDCASTYRIIGINLELHKLVNSTDLFIQFQKVDQGSSSLGNHWSGYKLLRSVGRGTWLGNHSHCQSNQERKCLIVVFEFFWPQWCCLVWLGIVFLVGLGITWWYCLSRYCLLTVEWCLGVSSTRTPLHLLLKHSNAQTLTALWCGIDCTVTYHKYQHEI